jgi:hypothetical protein
MKKKKLKMRDPVARAVAELGGLSGGGKHHNREHALRRGSSRKLKHKGVNRGAQQY